MQLNKVLLSSVTMLAIAATLTACGVKTDTPLIGKIMGLTADQAMRIDDNICGTAEASAVMMDLQNKYKADFGGSIPNDTKFGTGSFEDYVKNKVESELSIVYALSAMAKSEGMSLSDEELEQVSQAARTYVDGLNEDEKAYAGATEESITNLYTNYYLADMYYEKHTEGISDKITDEEVRVMKIQYIFMDAANTDKKQAADTLKQVKKQVENGYQDFVVQANKYTDAPSVEITLCKNEADEDWENAAFDLKENQISKVIQADDGVYLIKCVKAYLEDETKKNKESIITANKTGVIKEDYNEFVENKTFDINNEVWDAMSVSESDKVNSTALFEVYDQYLSDK